jgi:hypothetical protein
VRILPVRRHLGRDALAEHWGRAGLAGDVPGVGIAGGAGAVVAVGAVPATAAILAGQTAVDVVRPQIDATPGHAVPARGVAIRAVEPAARTAHVHIEAQRGIRQQGGQVAALGGVGARRTRVTVQAGFPRGRVDGAGCIEP